jgi:hypothetical protein
MRLDLLDDIFLHELERLKRPIGLFGKDQRGVSQLAFRVGERSIAKIQQEYRCARRDRSHQCDSARDRQHNRPTTGCVGSDRIAGNRIGLGRRSFGALTGPGIELLELCV